MSDLDTSFKTATAEANTLAKRPDNDTMLQLYALYKQATVGDNAGKRPGFTDPVGRAKFDAWAKMKGVDSNTAKQKYIDLVERLKKAN